MATGVDHRHAIGEVWADDKGLFMSSSDDNPIRELRILHIEANDMDALFVLRSLEGLAEHLRLERGTAADAISRMEEPDGWDVVLADPYTPNLSVPELLDAAKRVCPVLLVTGPVPAPDALSWGRLGLVDVIAKQHTSAASRCFKPQCGEPFTAERPICNCKHGSELHNAENLPLISSQQRSQRADLGHQLAQSRQTPHLFLQG